MPFISVNEFNQVSWYLFKRTFGLRQLADIVGRVPCTSLFSFQTMAATVGETNLSRTLFVVYGHSQFGQYGIYLRLNTSKCKFDYPCKGVF